jgi:hypothetical protein
LLIFIAIIGAVMICEVVYLRLRVKV